jgi:hypothetical protein
MRLKVYRYLHDVTAPSRTGLAWFDLVEIGLVAFGFLLYFLVRGAVVDRDALAFANARWVIDLQDSLGIFIEPNVNRWALQSDVLVRLFNFVYFWMDFPLIVSVGLFLFWRRRDYYTLLRDALLISGGFALLLYWSFPVAPPRLMTEWGFVDTLQVYSDLAYQAQSTAAFVNPYAAVPSLHVGWSVILVIVVFWATRNWWLRFGAIATVVLQSIAVVATANHYIFDGVVGAIVCLISLSIAVWLQRTGYPAVRAWLRRRIPASEPVEPVAT